MRLARYSSRTRLGIVFSFGAVAPNSEH